MTITINDWPGFMPGQSSSQGVKVDVIITKGTVADGKKFSPSKKVISLPKAEARLLVNYGAAKAVEVREREVKVENKEDEKQAETSKAKK